MEKTYDMKPLDAEQMKAAKDLILMAQKFSDDVKQIMIHSHLWHKGFALKLHVIPTLEIFSEDIQMYRKVEDGDGVYDEEIERIRGLEEYDNGWETYPTCTSREFIHLFDAVQDEAGTKAGTSAEETVPDCNQRTYLADNTHALDCGNEVGNG